jgi:hypothetical protein
MTKLGNEKNGKLYKGLNKAMNLTLPSICKQFEKIMNCIEAFD